MKPALIPTERHDKDGQLKLMAVAEGYVMARRKGCPPFVVPVQKWCGITPSSRVITTRAMS